MNRSIRRAAVSAVATLLASGAISATPAEAGRAVQDDEPEARVRDLQYRWRALDNSERVEQGGEGTTITFAADVLFAFDQATLAPEAAARLDEVARQLAELSPRHVAIAGHSDSHGEPAYNQGLSEQRARAVRDALAARLGDGYSFDVTGHGETQPVAPNTHDGGSDNPEGRALNRRVEISFPTT